LLDMNPAGLAMIEADNLQAVQGKSLLQFLVPEYRNDFFNLIKKVFDGESGTLEFEIIGLKGTRRRMDTHAVPMRDANQNIIAQLAITRDVTVKKKGERDLRESESKYRTLMQQAGDSIVLFNEMGQILEANESALQLLGYSSEEYKNMSLKDFVFEEDLRDSPFRFDLLKGGEPTITRRRLKRKDGSAVETELHVKKLSEGRYLGAARDLTDRIKAEQQLRESENRLREITASLPGVVYQIVITNDGKIRFNFLSDSISKYMDEKADEIYKDSNLLLSKIHPDDIGRLMAAIAVSTKKREPLTIIYRTKIKNGNYIWVRSDSIPALQEDGSVLRNGSIIDITEAQEAEEKLRESE
ncbi:MAG: PAS domain S-box protein, partial [Bacteroidota bacterium]